MSAPIDPEDLYQRLQGMRECRALVQHQLDLWRRDQALDPIPPEPQGEVMLDILCLIDGLIEGLAGKLEDPTNG